MRPSLLDPLFASASALPGVGPKIGKLLDRLLGEVGPPRPRPRPAAAPAAFLHRPPRAACHRGCADRRRLDHQGARRRAPAATRKGALPRPDRGRDRRPDAGLLPRQFRLDRETPAARRDALGFRPCRNLRRLPPDGPSGPHPRRGGPCRPAPGRAGLWPHRRAVSARDGQGGGRRAGAAAALAGMAGRKIFPRDRLAVLRRQPRPPASSANASGPRAGRKVFRAARL